MRIFLLLTLPFAIVTVLGTSLFLLSSRSDNSPLLFSVNKVDASSYSVSTNTGDRIINTPRKKKVKARKSTLVAKAIKPTSSPTPTPTDTPTPTPTKKPTPTPTKKPSPTPTKTVTPVTEISGDPIKNYIMQKINEYRSSQGLSAVKTDSYTCDFAKVRAEEISHNFNHDGFRSRIDSHTLPYPSYHEVTENIAMTSDYKEVVTMWINSSGHAENMRRDTPLVCVEKFGNYYAYDAYRP